MKTIVAVDQNWGIGFKGNLLIRLSGDMKFFRERTLGKTIVVGRETLESFPGGRALSDRTTVCLTRNRDFKADCVTVYSLEDCLDFLGRFSTDNIFIAGGESIYRQFLPFCNVCLVTRIGGEFKADRYFIDLDEHEDFELARSGETCVENGVEYRFTEYRRVSGDNNRQKSGKGSV